MFNNIGKKIKGLAKFICWLGIVGSVIAGIVLCSLHMSVIGFLTIVLGALLSWIGSFFIYGFGQLIENSDIIVSQNKQKILNQCATKTEKTTTVYPHNYSMTNLEQRRIDVENLYEKTFGHFVPKESFPEDISDWQLISAMQKCIETGTDNLYELLKIDPPTD